MVGRFTLVLHVGSTRSINGSVYPFNTAFA